MAYLENGNCACSNNAAERRTKSYVQRKKLLNIYQYLYTLLLYMPDYKNSPAGIEALMPWSDFVKKRCTGECEQKNELPENRERIPV